MADYKIYVSGFFECHRAFPWDVLGYGVPKYGSVHSYMCSILAPLAHRVERPLLDGKPSISEVGRLARFVKDNGQILQTQNDPPFVTPDIYAYCTHLYDKSKSDRTDVAQEVLQGLRKFEFYQEWVRERLDYLWKQGLINIPRHHLVLVDPPTQDNGRFKKGW
jgi:hypothetical protein